MEGEILVSSKKEKGQFFMFTFLLSKNYQETSVRKIKGKKYFLLQEINMNQGYYPWLLKIPVMN